MVTVALGDCDFDLGGKYVDETRWRLSDGERGDDGAVLFTPWPEDSIALSPNSGKAAYSFKMIGGGGCGVKGGEGKETNNLEESVASTTKFAVGA